MLSEEDRTGHAVVHCEDCGAASSEAERRIEKALGLILRFGGFDGAHHKTWVLDQAVRALTGCPEVTKSAKDYKGAEYTYETQGESEEYAALVKEVGDWDVGVPP